MASAVHRDGVEDWAPVDDEGEVVSLECEHGLRSLGGHLRSFANLVVLWVSAFQFLYASDTLWELLETLRECPLLTALGPLYAGLLHTRPAIRSTTIQCLDVFTRLTKVAFHYKEWNPYGEYDVIRGLGDAPAWCRWMRSLKSLDVVLERHCELPDTIGLQQWLSRFLTCHHALFGAQIQTATIMEADMNMHEIGNDWWLEIGRSLKGVASHVVVKWINEATW